MSRHRMYRAFSKLDMNSQVARWFPEAAPVLLAVNLILDGAVILFAGAAFMTWLGHGQAGQALAIVLTVAAYLALTLSPVYDWAETAGRWDS